MNSKTGSDGLKSCAFAVSDLSICVGCSQTFVHDLLFSLCCYICYGLFSL